MPYKNKEAKLAWKERNKEKLKEQNKRLREKYPERYKNSSLKYLYKISIEDWQKLFDKQNGCCAICGKHQSEFTKALHTDHCHTTGKVRGLLCGSCNRAIGLLQHDIELLIAAQTYLSEE